MRTMTKCFLAAVLTATALLGLVFAQTAAAQIWSNIASSCVLDSSTAAKADVNSGFGTVGFKGAKLGRIRLTCPFSGSSSAEPARMTPLASRSASMTTTAGARPVECERRFCARTWTHMKEGVTSSTSTRIPASSSPSREPAHAGHVGVPETCTTAPVITGCSWSS